ncbi:hypothetical protein COO60DRAFT_1461474 [Scenedesmus sp. NREL 46B-D3]|nr:hypothetical protein COO60DRAFT_1461474 [Scenedesmus sp. NREL 46B-D3]
MCLCDEFSMLTFDNLMFIKHRLRMSTTAGQPIKLLILSASNIQYILGDALGLKMLWTTCGVKRQNLSILGQLSLVMFKRFDFRGHPPASLQCLVLCCPRVQAAEGKAGPQVAAGVAPEFGGLAESRGWLRADLDAAQKEEAACCAGGPRSSAGLCGGKGACWATRAHVRLFMRKLYAIADILREHGVLDILHPSRIVVKRSGKGWLLQMIMSPAASLVGDDMVSASLDLMSAFFESGGFCCALVEHVPAHHMMEAGGKAITMRLRQSSAAVECGGLPGPGGVLGDLLLWAEDKVLLLGTSYYQLSSKRIGHRQLSSTRMGSRQLSSKRIGHRQLSSTRMGSRQLSSKRIGHRQLSSTRMGSTQLSSKRIGHRQLSSTRMGSRQLSSTGRAGCTGRCAATGRCASAFSAQADGRCFRCTRARGKTLYQLECPGQEAEAAGKLYESIQRVMNILPHTPANAALRIMTGVLNISISAAPLIKVVPVTREQVVEALLSVGFSDDLLPDDAFGLLLTLLLPAVICKEIGRYKARDGSIWGMYPPQIWNLFNLENSCLRRELLFDKGGLAEHGRECGGIVGRTAVCTGRPLDVESQRETCGPCHMELVAALCGGIVPVFSRPLKTAAAMVILLGVSEAADLLFVVEVVGMELAMTPYLAGMKRRFKRPELTGPHV